MNIRFASIIQEGLSLEANKGFGVKDGHAADRNGILKVAQWAFTAVRIRTGRLSSVSIMVNLILNQYIPTVTAASLTLLTYQGNLLTMTSAPSILGISELKISAAVMVCGLVASLMKEKGLVALSQSIKQLSILMKMPKSFSLTSHSRILQIIGFTKGNTNLISNYTAASLDVSGRALMFPKKRSTL
jgi:hypothetical protein